MSSPATPLRADVQALRDAEDLDVLIIGGGINGLATLRDLALQGVSVALVERGDFVSGASSASSHMVHGGIRYLENGEFRLVKEAVTERNDLLKTAPHYVKPLETTIPIYKTFSGILSAPFRLLVTHGRGKPNERGALLIKVGLIMYDTFSRDGGSVPRHKFLGKKKSLSELPKLNPDLAYTATYFDASMHDPERIALDVLRDGIEAGAGRTQAVNYVSAVGADANGVRVRDEVSGEEFSVKAKVVLNTAGPWTDLANKAMGLDTTFMGGTKGSHIVLDNPELLAATGGREIFFEHSDGRIVLIYPLKDRVLVGTTDIDADPSKPVVCTDDEIEYFFDLIGHVFPTIGVDRSQIVYTFSGIRPLPRHDDTAPGFVSRDYRIVEDEVAGVPAMSLVGGKWTTFRALAEHLSMKTLQKLRRPHRVSTQGLPIGGGAGFPATPEQRRRWIAARTNAHSAELVEAMLERYGTRADAILAALPAEPTPVPDAAGYYREELAFIAKNEQVVHLIDVLLRRTHLAFVGGMTERTLREVAEAVAEPLGWDSAHVDEEVARTTEILRSAHRVDLAQAGVARI
ncbi:MULTISPECIES: glycerol-3-phosphate dehydrogenase/oxidase [Microbacterium]|uniref:Glycerol-3-phosphate dehydrogenase n=1 Tax=Microbacterium testaceum TaxID=2033 RepID=A0A4Y3QI47_MICTE|nr:MULTISPECIES: glycerol-3-phosphate dehydrogenase/oxidase [Microbacterium]MDZ5143264.1 glycerol-3-phosphate dehydrogenase/oxidase [Microbacterium testaceum]PNW07966.1 FAD-dependent oxidoreductase [Microbacterium testaceum]REC99349.1 glycerol-3-phosphate dehydrogenase [Microbacterium sp. AG157]WAC68087.1 glycerol-3-phosphate dehydrogenase/oxidase [Microbacterium sp. SL75]GEB44589.1 glycerol-3-phosphate dehydrogenase [Microbacterium testaceum]